MSFAQGQRGPEEYSGPLPVLSERMQEFLDALQSKEGQRCLKLLFDHQDPSHLASFLSCEATPTDRLVAPEEIGISGLKFKIIQTDDLPETFIKFDPEQRVVYMRKTMNDAMRSFCVFLIGFFTASEVANILCDAGIFNRELANDYWLSTFFLILMDAGVIKGATTTDIPYMMREMSNILLQNSELKKGLEERMMRLIGEEDFDELLD